jgi:hypothetical protein
MAREEAWSRERLGTSEAKKPEAAPALRDEVAAVGGLVAGPAAPSDTPAPAEEEARELSLTAEAPASAVPPTPSISAVITVVKGGSGQNLLALRLSGQRPIRELTLQFGEAAPTAHEWRGAPGSPALIPLPGERIGTGPAAVPVTVATEEGRRQYTLFLPTLARLGESASQAPVGRWQAVAVDQALLDLSTFTGLVILAEQPLSDQLCGDIPAGTPEEALQQVAAEAGFEVHQDGPLAYTLTHAR